MKESAFHQFVSFKTHAPTARRVHVSVYTFPTRDVRIPLSQGVRLNLTVPVKGLRNSR